MRIEVSLRSLRRRIGISLSPLHWLWRLGMIAVCALGAAGVSAADSSSSESAPERPASPVSLDELPPLWEAQRSEIATAEIRFRCFNSTLETPGNTPERVAELLARHDLVARPDEFNAFLEALTGRQFDERQPWDEMVLTLSGRSRRVDGRFCTFVTNGDLEAVWTPTNRQLDLQPVGKSTVRHYRLDDLRWIPPAHVSANDWQFLRVLNGAAVFDVPPLPDGPKFQVLTSIDPASGLVAHSITRHEGGDPAIEIYQSGLDVHSAGIVFPRLRIDLTYAAGAVYTARVMLIQQARFNETVPDAAFVMTVPAGARIVDLRTAATDVWIAATHAPDALRLPAREAATPSPAVADLSTSAASGLRWWLAAVHAVGVAALTLFIRRRRSLARSTSPVR